MHKLYYTTIHTPIPVPLPMGLKRIQHRTDKILYVADTNQQLPDGFYKILCDGVEQGCHIFGGLVRYGYLHDITQQTELYLID